jgi:sugar lactone lactonase YvrE
MITIDKPIELVVDYACLLGEGPVWDAQGKVICWVDILNGEIHEYSPEQKTHHTIRISQPIGAIVLSKGGNFLAAMKNGFGLINRISGEVTMLTDPEHHLPGSRFNDGKCDPAGRFWAGTVSLTEQANAGSVYVLEKDYSATRKITGTTISNGMAWSPDEQVFYYIDTATFEVVAYAYERSTGHISNKRTVIKVAKEDGYPDGMTVDSEGMLWIAHWDGWQIIRWDPCTGKKLHRIQLPVSKVSSCTFGGENMGDFYITSAKLGLTETEIKKQPLAGALFVLRDCGFKGIPAFEFEI